MLRQSRPLTWSVTLEVDVPSADREAVIEQTASVIETRLNALSLSGFEVRVEGASANARIVVNLPDVPDRERVKRMITARGRLEITHVISPPSPAPAQTYNTREEATVSLGVTLPANRRVLPYAEQGSDSQAPKKWVVVESPAIVDGSELRNARAVQSGTRPEDYQIAFSLKPAGAERFASWTGANINEYLGIALNDEVKSIAYIKGQISDQGEIGGRFTKEHAEDLAQVLKSGALPAPVRIVEEGARK